ncbi:isoleucine--tRNA ligase [Candidatus Woesearchaeota archaeon]|nr:isoleucine--tRNA ligase [Candidatus Woesearchaeota archaeon]
MQSYNPIEVEKEILAYWEKNKIFNKLRKKNQGKKHYSFIDGPITANNPMGVHHAWGRTYKDLFQRFKAMQGYDQRYQNGFDCQGLWVEVEVEKELGFNSKKEIENYGLDKFSRACKARVDKYSKVQTEQSKRLGQWNDWDNSYYTLTDNNIEHIWHFLKKCHEKGWLYKNTRVMPWCYRCGTSLSHHELLDGYTDMEHDSTYVFFKIKNKEEYLLVWTTTPWTLPANMAVAVNPNIDYIKVKLNKKIFYIGKKMSESVLKEFKDHKILDMLPGRDLVNIEYEAPFDSLPINKGNKHKIIPFEGVGEDEGTSLLHVAPGCGEEDHELGKKYSLKEIAPLDEAGIYADGFGEFSNKHVKKVNKEVIETLDKEGKLFQIKKYLHRYPKCWRCKEELVFRLVSEWFISSDEIRPLMKKEAEKVYWYPEHASKLMQDWLDNMQDWAISRKRYWGLPLMFYECQCGHLEVIGSKKELKEKAVNKKLVDKLPEFHKPWIDEIKIKCPSCSSEVERVKDVGDCWLDAGIVPYSTLNYLTDKKYWQKWFPAKLIVEMREQIRLWFYSMLFMSITLENKTPYEKVLVYEKVYDEKGKPMHKSSGNAIWFDDGVEKMGADVMRYIYTSQNPQFNVNFGYSVGKEVLNTLKIVWNLANYVQTYCKSKKYTKLRVEDRWILSRLENTKLQVLDNLEKLQVHKAHEALQRFLIDDLSRGYGKFIRDNLDDKNTQAVLHICFLDGIKLLAPFLPFMTEKLYLEISNKKESIFLEEYPEPDKKLINPELEKQMEILQKIIQDALAERDKVGIGVKWPLSSLKIFCDKDTEKAISNLESLLKNQVNIKKILVESSKDYKLELDTKFTKELEKEGYTREVIRKIQNFRKESGLKKSDKINLGITINEENIDDYLDLTHLKKKVGAKIYSQNPDNKEYMLDFKVKDIKFKIGFNIIRL